MACLFNTLKGLCLPLFWEFSFPLGSFPSLPHTAWVGLSVELPGTLWSKDGHVINLDQSDSSESDWHVLGNDRGDVFQLWSLYLFLSPRPLELFKFLFFFFDVLLLHFFFKSLLLSQILPQLFSPWDSRLSCVACMPRAWKDSALVILYYNQWLSGLSSPSIMCSLGMGSVNTATMHCGCSDQEVLCLGAEIIHSLILVMGSSRSGYFSGHLCDTSNCWDN